MKMAPSHIRDVLASFSPSLDLFAMCRGDGRIKIWDTGKGQLQTEFADIASSEPTNIFGKSEGGHLSIDYTCMKWLSLDKKKKRKLGSSILVLGTGGGDVLALDVSAGQLKWRFNNCNPGGVNDISFHANASHIYTAGVDGMICIIDSMVGTLLKKCNAASSAISSLVISPDGKLIATAAAQIKVFNCSNQKKLQKFSGHPGSVRCMVFSEDGRYVLSSSLGERYIALWKVDGSKNRQATVLLAMDHPAVFLDCKCVEGRDADDAGLSVLAISEKGVCYFWHGSTIDAMRNCKPAKISIPCDDETLQKHKGIAPSIFWAKLQHITEPATGHVFLAHGLLIKPTFEKVVVHSGKDLSLNVPQDGFLLPDSGRHKSKKGSNIQSQVTALDRSNAEGALRPVPKILDLIDEKSEDKRMEIECVLKDKDELDTVTLCMEERLRSLGILSNSNDPLSSKLDIKLWKDIKLDETIPHRKVKRTVAGMEPNDALNLLKGLVEIWQNRFHDGKDVLRWICCILVYHSDYVKFQDPKLLDSLYKATKSQGSAINSLLQLSGRLQLVSAQIDKASNIKPVALERDNKDDESEDEEEDADEVIYGLDEDSEMESDGDE